MTRLLTLIPRTRTSIPMRDLVDRFFEDRNLPTLFDEEDSWITSFDITENEKEYIVTAELPGVDPKNVDVTLSEGILSVKGE